MSLKYLYNKLESMNAKEQIAYIKNIFQRFNITPYYPIELNFKDTKGKQSANKNPLGYIIMHLNFEQLTELIPEYYRQLLFNKDTFNIYDHILMNSIDRVVEAITNREPNGVLAPGFEIKPDKMLNVFMFGVGKYSPWSFLDLNPYTLVPALFRHLYKSEYISKVDEETGELHTAHAACNIYMIKHIINYIERVGQNES